MITSLAKKRGGMRRTDTDMELFGDTIAEKRLVDIQIINGMHTWNNRRGGNQQIASRLDRFLISEQVMRRDIFIKASILPGMGLDH